MNDLIKTLLGVGVTIGLSDRETFVKQISSIITEYQKDPEKAKKWTDATIAYLEQTRDNLNMQSAIKGVVADGSLPDKQKIEELTLAIKELTKELQRKDKT